MRSFSVLRSALHRALALVLGCVLGLAWVGLANSMCVMTPGHAVEHAMRHQRMAAAPIRTVDISLDASMNAAMANQAPVPHARGPGSGSSGRTMPWSCAGAVHCAALTAATVTPAVAADAGTIRVTRACGHGPLLGPSDSVVEPSAPPPRA